MSKYPQLNWRSHACIAIEDAIKKAPKGSDLIKAIDAAYPFGERKYHPYKIWLDERRKALIRLNFYKPPQNRQCPYHPNGQTCLICMNKGAIA